MYWIIVSKTEHDEETGKRLVWNNKLGWVSGLPTIFETQEGNLPMNGEWKLVERVE